MARLESFDGTALSYEVAGDGPPVVLLHGFAADSDGNWVRPGVVSALLASGRKAITLDARGHGRSDKPHEPSAYAGDAMVRDAQALLDHLRIDSSAVVGYSMGSITAAWLAIVETRVNAVVLGGMGGVLIGKGGDGSQSPAGRAAIADALVAEDPTTIPTPAARRFRRFADLMGADRFALAAVQRSGRVTRPNVEAIRVPVLVLNGRADKQVGSPDDLAAAIPGARVRIIGGDHLSAINNAEFAPAIVEFLDEVSSR